MNWIYRHWRVKNKSLAQRTESSAILKTTMRKLKEVEARLNETPDKQTSLTDSDAGSMKKRSYELDASLRARLPLQTFNH